MTIMESGPRLPAVIRQRQTQTDAGPSIITTPPRAVKFSISAYFIASTYMQNIIKHSKEYGIQQCSLKINSPQRPVSTLILGQVQRPAPPARLPNSLFTTPQSTPASTSQNHCDTEASDVNVPTPMEATADSETSPLVSSNEEVDGGIGEVESFLENCSPSMIHHLDSFIRAGVKNGRYLRAVGRLCVLDSNSLSSVLESSDFSVVDSILLRDCLLGWVEERSRGEG